MPIQTTLQTLINNGSELTEEQKDSLYQLVSLGCHRKTKDALRRKIYNVPLSCWANYGILGRLHLEMDNTFSYCAGQDYREEMKTVRQCLL